MFAREIFGVLFSYLIKCVCVDAIFLAGLAGLAGLGESASMAVVRYNRAMRQGNTAGQYSRAIQQGSNRKWIADGRWQEWGSGINESPGISP